MKQVFNFGTCFGKAEALQRSFALIAQYFLGSYLLRQWVLFHFSNLDFSMFAFIVAAALKFALRERSCLGMHHVLDLSCNIPLSVDCSDTHTCFSFFTCSYLISLLRIAGEPCYCRFCFELTIKPLFQWLQSSFIVAFAHASLTLVILLTCLLMSVQRAIYHTCTSYKFEATKK